MANKTISELSTATLSDNLVMVVEGATATEKTTVASLKEYIQEGVSIDVDSALSATSENPVQNKVITTALNNKVDSSSLASVATSGAYSDLTGTPTIPAAQIQSDWNQTDDSALDYIKNKPIIPEGIIVDQTYNPESTNAQSGIAVHQAISGKQDVLTSGSNITIENGVISATDTTYTAGVGISIENGVISNTQTSAEWGNITGTLSEQTDLKNVLDTKADQENVYTKQEINNLMSSIVVATVYDYGDE